MKESDTLVPIKFLDTFEEFEPWTPLAYSAQPSVAYPGSPSYTVSTFRYLCKLSTILSDILSTIYTERSFNNTPGELLAKLEAINSRLTKWYHALPEHLHSNVMEPSLTPPPHVLNLQSAHSPILSQGIADLLSALYHVLVILLHHPFIADGHHYHKSRSVSANSLRACATAANSIVQLVRAYDKAFSVRRAPYLISYATYMAATIHARIAAKRDAGSDAHKNLGTCLAVFNENQQTNSAVRRANGLVQNLMKRLGVRVPTDSEIHIDKENPDGANRENVAAAQSGVLGQEPGLHDLDIDSIIQTFVREPETPQLRGTTLPNYANVAVQPQSSTASGTATPTIPYQNGDAMPTDFNGVWAIPSFNQPSGDGSMSFDDLFYGFNSSALDSFPVTPIPRWDGI